jgi:hypothetical protein
VVGQLEALNRQVFGKKSEKMPPMDREVRKKRPPDPAVTQERRRKNAELRATRVVTNDVQHAVPADQRRCPYCGKPFIDGCSGSPRYRLLMEPRSITTWRASSHAPIETAEPVQRSRCQASRAARCRVCGIPSRA